MRVLYVIPARGGSKGIPYKNIKSLHGKPLIGYSIDIAREFTADENICVSTDDERIAETVKEYGLNLPFMRPDRLSTDNAGTYEVLLHALEHYERFGVNYDVIVLLQPTSPFRLHKHLQEATALFDRETDMVVSVKEATANPYYNCFEEDSNGYLRISKGEGRFTRRQDIPRVWEYNGSIYVISVNSLKEKNISDFLRVKKYIMDAPYSVDIDNMFDWKIAELMLKEKMVIL